MLPPPQYHQLVALGLGPKSHSYDRVREVMCTGKLQRNVVAAARPPTEREAAVAAMSKVWGAGRFTAMAWYGAGCHSVEDVRRRAAGDADVRVTGMQRIGLLYHEDLLLRVPREEVAAAEGFVRAAALRALGLPPDAFDGIDPTGVGTTRSAFAAPYLPLVRATGSYRRGSPDASDFDFVVAPPAVLPADVSEGAAAEAGDDALQSRLYWEAEDAVTAGEMLSRLLRQLRADGFMNEGLGEPPPMGPGTPDHFSKKRRGAPAYESGSDGEGGSGSDGDGGPSSSRAEQNSLHFHFMVTPLSPPLHVQLRL